MELSPPRILVVGSGPGALEATLALAAADGLDVRIDLISPEIEFEYRPNLVMEPFGVQQTAHYSVAAIIADPAVRQWQGTIERIDPAVGCAWSPEGDEFPFDALVLATGVTPRAYLPAPTITMGAPGSIDALRTVVAEVDSGAIRDVVFTAPQPPFHRLPLYELALMTAERAERQSGQQVAVAIATPEQSPLDVFGARHSETVERLCATLGVRLLTATTIDSFDGSMATFANGDRRAVDRLIAMPGLDPCVPQGVPVDSAGFVPVGADQLVPGTTNIYAIGDVTDRMVKLGSLATEQADVAAAAIATKLGDATPREPADVVHAVLLTAGRRIPLAARIGTDGSESIDAPATSGPQQKIESRLLTQRLHQLPAA